MARRALVAPFFHKSARPASSPRPAIHGQGDRQTPVGGVRTYCRRVPRYTCTRVDAAWGRGAVAVEHDSVGFRANRGRAVDFSQAMTVLRSPDAGRGCSMDVALVGPYSGGCIGRCLPVRRRSWPRQGHPRATARLGLQAGATGACRQKSRRRWARCGAAWSDLSRSVGSSTAMSSAFTAFPRPTVAA